MIQEKRNKLLYWIKRFPREWEVIKGMGDFPNKAKIIITEILQGEVPLTKLKEINKIATFQESKGRRDVPPQSSYMLSEKVTIINTKKSLEGLVCTFISLGGILGSFVLGKKEQIEEFEKRACDLIALQGWAQVHNDKKWSVVIETPKIEYLEVKNREKI